MSGRCVSIDETQALDVGGKAEGLRALRALGLAVPDAFVIVGAARDSLPEDLVSAYNALGGGRVAVRSSALGEDGESASFAGQHLTKLDVEGEAALKDAVTDCLASLESDAALAYRKQQASDAPARMCVVVQKMVDARAAGVLFTADPVTGRRDRVVVDAVRGLGEALVSGHASPDRFLLDRRGRVIRAEKTGAEPVLDDVTLASLVQIAVRVADERGTPLDFEWAIGRDGTIAWLQARPITTLSADVRELDFCSDREHIYTRCNIGEMMPGAVTPLTWSTSARGIDFGMQWVYQKLGAQSEITRENRFVAMSFGHLFLDLTNLASISAAVPGSSANDACAAICGRAVPEVVDSPKHPLGARLKNGLTYFRLMTSTKPHLAALEEIVARMPDAEGRDARASYAAIDAALPDLFMAYAHHLVCSMGSGAAATALLRVLSSNEPPTEAHHSEVAALLAGATDVESHDVAAGIDRIAHAVLAHRDGERVANGTLEDAAAFLHAEEAPDVRAELNRYLARHGHRSVREVELRQKEWSADKTPVVESIRRAVGAALLVQRDRRSTLPASRDVPISLKPLVLAAHAGIRAREAAKSLLVLATAKLKQAYRMLAAHLVIEGMLPDEDLVYFLTHEELGELVHGRNPGLAARAAERRKALPLQMDLVFPDVFRGLGEPVEIAPVLSGEKALVGKPVSRGIVRGRARVARTEEEARLVEPGEILIAPITDVGWTPLFRTIAGLATDIGSAVSHGAVVAREYGLPAVVDLRVATRTFETGDRVVLDAITGVLKLDEDA